MDDAKFIERLNFYPRSPRGERLQKAMKKREKRTISIHAPREGSDVDDYQFVRLWNISIHAPREGSDSASSSGTGVEDYFYPRSPRGERPPFSGRCTWRAEDFYPRSPRGERHRLRK